MLKALYVEWDDSQTLTGWTEPRDMDEPTPNKSIGWLVKETDDWLWLTTSVDLDGPTYVDPLAIPKVAIRKRLFVETFPE